MNHKHAVLGGTFDRIHDGHVSYLKTAFENSDRVTIGLTTDKLNGDKEFNQLIQPYNVRKKELLKIIQERWPQIPVRILSISDIYGPSITDPMLDAIVVTDLTLENGKKVNAERTRRGLKELKIVLASIIAAQDSRILSSSRIRRGEIDRQGQVYNQFFSSTVLLPDSLRQELRKPLGNVIISKEGDKDKAAFKAKQIVDREKYSLSIAVGDIVSSTLENSGFLPDIKIIDFKTQREFLHSIDRDRGFDAENIAGTINASSAKYLEIEIARFVKSKVKREITIDGEEDLLVLPAIMLAPLGSVVFYGQRDTGIVIVKVTEEIKNQMAELVKRFI